MKSHPSELTRKLLGATGAAVALAVVGLFLRESANSDVRAQTLDVEKSIQAAEGRLHDAKEWRKQADKRREALTRQSTEGAAVQAEVDALAKQVEALEGTVKKHTADAEQARKELAEAISTVRRNAEGAKMGQLQLPDGRRLDQVVIKQAKPTFLELVHAGGGAILLKKDVSPELQDRFRLEEAKESPIVDIEVEGGLPRIQIELLIPGEPPKTESAIAKYRANVDKVRRQVTGAQQFLDVLFARQANQQAIGLERFVQVKEVEDLAASSGMAERVAGIREQMALAARLCRELTAQLDAAELEAKTR